MINIKEKAKGLNGDELIGNRIGIRNLLLVGEIQKKTDPKVGFFKSKK